MQNKLTTSLLGIGFLVLVASMAFQGLEQKAFADVMMSNVTVSCGLHCVMKQVTHPLGKMAYVAKNTILTKKVAPTFKAKLGVIVAYKLAVKSGSGLPTGSQNTGPHPPRLTCIDDGCVWGQIWGTDPGQPGACPGCFPPGGFPPHHYRAHNN